MKTETGNRGASMTNATRLIQYIYLDIVEFTKKRTIEAQAEVISILNTIVKSVIEKSETSIDDRILLPTGDGLAICLIAPDNHDLGLKISLQILSALYKQNLNTKEDSRKFLVRIGVNQNVDNIIVDINGNRNVAGRGINQAHRLMNCSDGMQIIVGSSVYEILCEREAYVGAFAQFESIDKHGNRFDCYQLIDSDYEYLNINEPAKFKINEKPKPVLTPTISFVIAMAVKHRDFLSSMKGEIYFRSNSTILLYLLALDALDDSQRGKHDRVYSRIKTGLKEAWHSIEKSFRPACDEAEDYIIQQIEMFPGRFEYINYRPALFLPSQQAIVESKQLHPNVWKSIFPESILE